MTDILRLVVQRVARRNVVLRDYQDINTYFRVKDSFKHIPATRHPEEVAFAQRYGGRQTVGESQENGSIQFSVAVQGASSDAGIIGVENLVADLEAYVPQVLLVEFRPTGASFSTYYETRGPATWSWNYNQPQFAGTTLSIVDLQIPVAPLGLQDQMDVVDDFAVDSKADYTFDSGATTDVTISGGTMAPAGTMSTERRLRHTIRGYQNGDVQDTVRFTIGTTLTSFKAGVVQHGTSALNYIEVYVDDTGAASRLRIDIVVAGVRTNKASSSIARMTTGQTAWVRGRVDGFNIWAEYFILEPTPTAAPAGSIGSTMNLVNYTQPQLDALVSGSSGIVWIPQQALARIDDFVHYPYTYTNRPLPDYLSLSAIPGTAPALADVHITNASGGAAAPIWPLFAWGPKPDPFNYIWNGDFEEDVNGWSLAIVTSVQAVAGSSITRDTTAARNKFGIANAVIVTPASTGAGANFPMYRRFKLGVPYTAVIWASAAASTTSMVVKLGSGGDVATSAAAALTTTPTAYTVTVIPAIDRDVMYVSIQTNAATATTFNIDGVMVYEGAVAPSLGRHPEGAGAVPPFGIIEGETADSGDLTIWSVQADGSSRMAFKLQNTTASGVQTYGAGWWLDPALMASDDFAISEIDVEFWGVVTVSATLAAPRMIISARPEWGTSFGAERFTAEFGSAGKPLTVPSSGSARRPVRLGTVTLTVDPDRPARWKLWLKGTTATGSSGTGLGLDYLLAVPIRRRIVGVTNKANDAGYPDFISSTSETTRIITSSLRGLVAKPPFPAQPTAGAVGGPPIEVGVGNVDLLVKLSSLAPDDPTSDTTTEQLAHTATVHLAVTPRVYLMRGL